MSMVGMGPLQWGMMPGATQVWGRERNDPQRQVCEGHGGRYMDMRAPTAMMPGAPEPPVTAFCEIGDRQSTYNRGMWEPPLNSLTGFGSDLGSASTSGLMFAALGAGLVYALQGPKVGHILLTAALGFLLGSQLDADIAADVAADIKL